MSPHPSLRDTFSPEGEGLGGCAVVYTKGIHNVPFRGSTERAPAKTKKTPLVI